LSSRVLHGLGDILAQRSPDSFAGISVDNATGTAVMNVKAESDLAGVVRMANDNVVSTLQGAADTALDDPPRFTLTVRMVKRSLTELEGIRERAVHETWTHDVGSRLAVDWVDPATNQVVVGLTSVSDKDRAAADERFGAGTVRLIQRERPQKASRLDDRAPWWGGIRLFGPCSTGFTVTRAGGIRYMLTSGHCGPLNTNHYNYGNAPTDWVGSVKFIDYTSGGYDTALIGGSTYAPYIFTGNCLSCLTYLPVKGISYPLPGNYVCYDGSVTGEYCNTYLEAENICVTYTNKLRTCHLNSTLSSDLSKSGSAPGDSGGPVFRPGSGGALAVGIIDGSGTNNLAYYTPISLLLSRWSALLVQG